MVTQKDIHNHIVENAEPWQKQYLSLKCGNCPEKIKEVEQSMSNLVNGLLLVLDNAGIKYLNERID